MPASTSKTMCALAAGATILDALRYQEAVYDPCAKAATDYERGYRAALSLSLRCVAGACGILGENWRMEFEAAIRAQYPRA